MLSEYINRETLRDLMYTEAFERDTGLQRWDSGLWIRYKLFENCLDATPVADVVERPCWISVKERLPEDREDVLCWLLNIYGEPYAAVGCYNATLKMWDIDSEYAEPGSVTHWITFPVKPED